MRWCGPKDNAGAQEEFEELFARRALLTADCFKLADQTQVLAHVNRRLKLRGLAPCDKLPVEFALPFIYDLIPPGAKLRLQQYVQARATMEGIGGTFLCDVDHWLAVGRYAGPFFPCQVTHGTIISVSSCHLFIALEHAAAMGIHAFESISKVYKSALSEVLQKLSEQEVKELCGNAMSLPAFASFMAYCLANSERRSCMLPIADTNMLTRGSSSLLGSWDIAASALAQAHGGRHGGAGDSSGSQSERKSQQLTQLTEYSGDSTE